MGHDEDKNNFGGGVNPPITPGTAPGTVAPGTIVPGTTPQSEKNAMDELNRIAADSNPNRIEATGTGDIKLSSGEKKPMDKKIIIIIVLLIITVIAFAVGMVATKGKLIENITGGSSVDENKVAYQKLIQYGDTNSENEVNKDMSVKDSYLYDMTTGSSSSDERSEYSAKLVDAYKKYKNESDSTYKLLEAYTKYTNLENELVEIEKIYLSSGEKDARNYFADELIEEENTDGTIKTLSIAEDLIQHVHNYKRLFVDELAAYSTSGCIIGGIRNEECINNMRLNVELFPDFADVEMDIFEINSVIGDYAENLVRALYKESIRGE